MMFIASNSLMVEAREWQQVFSGWFSFSALGPESAPMGVQIATWDEINESWADSILFNLTLYTGSIIRGKDFEVGEYYVESEDVIGLQFYIDNLYGRANISKVTLTVTSPDDTVYYNSTLLENHTGTNKRIVRLLDNDSFTFNKTGLWNFRLNFESNKSNLIWRYIGNDTYQTFKPIKNEDEFGSLIFYNFYSEEIPVLTLSEALQVSYMRDIARQTEYLNESAVAQEESAESQRNLAFGTMILAFATLTTAIIIIITFITRLSSQKKSIERQNKLLKDSFDKLTKAIEKQKKSSTTGTNTPKRTKREKKGK